MATIASLTKATNPKMAVEKIYQKKTQLEHILLRPDTYVGSMERVESEMWIWDFTTEKMIKKEIKYVPGLFKIFDEIIVNIFFIITIIKYSYLF
jgi:DNA topoisomerase II